MADMARECNLVLSMDVPEDTDVYMPMASRIAQLALVDVLATGFTLRRGMKFRENLKKVKEGLRESRFDTPHSSCHSGVRPRLSMPTGLV